MLKAHIVEAATIWWSEYVDSDACALVDSNNPEKIFLVKEAFNQLSKEAKEVAQVLFELPEEMFTNSGRVIRKNLIHYMKHNFGWSAEKTKIVQNEIATLFT